MFVCICKAVTESQLLDALRGAKEPFSADEILNQCGAGSDCGSCRHRVQKVLNQGREALQNQAAIASQVEE